MNKILIRGSTVFLLNKVDSDDEEDQSKMDDNSLLIAIYKNSYEAISVSSISSIFLNKTTNEYYDEEELDEISYPYNYCICLVVDTDSGPDVKEVDLEDESEVVALEMYAKLEEVFEKNKIKGIFDRLLEINPIESPEVLFEKAKKAFSVLKENGMAHLE